VDTDRLWSELKRRKVLRVGAIYLLIAWTLVQVAETVWEPLEFPPHTLTLLIWVAAAGFPVVLVLGWIYDITRKGIVKTTAAEQTPEVAEEESLPVSASVAVLPFADMSEAHNQGYFCDGVAEEILNTLTRIEGLHVASRTSSFQFRDQALDIQELGKRLKVNTILEGSVRKSGDQLRVTAQLINVANGYHLWSQRFDASMEDVFTVQDNIARCIAEALELNLGPEHMRAMIRSSTRDPKAYDYYLKGWSYFHRFDTQNMLFAREMFSRAIEVDNNFARAWAGLADAAAFLYLYSECREEYRQQAEDASNRALELCDDLAETHASRGLAHLLMESWEKSEQEFTRAIELNPNNFEAHYFFARACVHQGKMERAAELFKRAAEINPMDYHSTAFLPQVYANLGDKKSEQYWLKEAIRRGTRQLESNPDDVRALYLTGCLLARSGDPKKGLELGERAMALRPDASIVNYNLGCLFALAGDPERALQCLKASTEIGRSTVSWMEHDADLDSLRDDPRFQDILNSLCPVTAPAS
jgi:adenylate cyclase